MKIPSIPSFPFRTIKMNSDKTIRLLTTDGFGYHYIWMNEKVNEITDFEVRTNRKKAEALFNKICAEHVLNN